MNDRAIPQMSEEENALAGDGEGILPATNAQLLMPSGCIFCRMIFDAAARPEDMKTGEAHARPHPSDLLRCKES